MVHDDPWAPEDEGGSDRARHRSGVRTIGAGETSPMIRPPGPAEAGGFAEAPGANPPIDFMRPAEVATLGRRRSHPPTPLGTGPRMDDLAHHAHGSTRMGESSPTTSACAVAGGEVDLTAFVLFSGGRGASSGVILAADPRDAGRAAVPSRPADSGGGDHPDGGGLQDGLGFGGPPGRAVKPGADTPGYRRRAEARIRGEGRGRYRRVSARESGAKAGADKFRYHPGGESKTRGRYPVSPRG